MKHEDTLQIAKAVLQVQRIHDLSWVKPETTETGLSVYGDQGYYAKDWDQCIAEAEIKLGIHFRPMLRLMASSHYCDFQEWALQVVYKFEQGSDLVPATWTPFPGYFD